MDVDEIDYEVEVIAGGLPLMIYGTGQSKSNRELHLSKHDAVKLARIYVSPIAALHVSIR